MYTYYGRTENIDLSFELQIQKSLTIKSLLTEDFFFFAGDKEASENMPNLSIPLRLWTVDSSNSSFFSEEHWPFPPYYLERGI